MAKKKWKPETPQGWCCYIGPSVRGYAQYGDVFPDYAAARSAMAAALARWPQMEQLIVSGAALADARLRVKTPGNALYVLAQKLRRSLM